ncbi:unnamed protein product [Ranitomeya imitator]|uniref:Reverse transcriptase domain-containing protein n=1 Tax=Ranitomeya imitator TaxID=111125 RepID=A0ABN9M821_9NEOB|nr:unnamed protein product [Ranitomeya imitator]
MWKGHRTRYRKERKKGKGFRICSKKHRKEVDRVIVIRDTTSALQRLDQLCLEDNMIFVTADVESLYTSIRHQDGLDAVRFFLGTGSLDVDMVELILVLLEFLLTHNAFTFNNRIYLQLQGTAMGASCAPSYANLFLGAWEREVFQDDLIQDIGHIHNWMRYIDDVLFIWEGPLVGLERMIQHLNNNTKNIRLTFKYGRDIDFLDIKIGVGSNGVVHTDIFRKSTSTNSFLYADSSHPISTVRGIPVGQFLRARRICSDDIKFEKEAMDLTRRFTQRGYSKRMIKRGYLRVSKTPRNQL